MPPPPVVSVIVGDSALPPRRPDTRNAKTQTDTSDPSIVEELKSLAGWLADHHQNNDTDGYTADGFEESNGDLTVPADAYRATTAGASNLAPDAEPAASIQQGTGSGLRMGAHTGSDRPQPTAATYTSKGAADLA